MHKCLVLSTVVAVGCFFRQVSGVVTTNEFPAQLTVSRHCYFHLSEQAGESMPVLVFDGLQTSPCYCS
jgi:hypothetical protein